MPRHIKKGDTVIVTAGNSKGATGQVLRILTKEERVVVQGVNLRAKHIKPSQRNPQGGIIRKEMPIHISNVSPAVDGKATRVRFTVAKDGFKARIAVRNGKELHSLHGARTRNVAAAAPKSASKRRSVKSKSK